MVLMCAPPPMKYGSGSRHRNAGQRFQEKRELTAIELTQHLADEMRELGLIVLVATPIVVVVALNP